MLKCNHYNLLVPIDSRDEYLLFNTMNGGLVVLEKEEGQLMEQLSSNTFSLDDIDGHFRGTFDTLLEKEYIVDESVDEKALYHDIYFNNVKNRFYNKSSNIVMTIATTNRCNLKCPYCWETTKHNARLNDQIIDLIVDHVEGMMRKSTIEEWPRMGVTWFGGEPLLAPDAIEKGTKKFQAFADKHGMEYAADIITNGTLLTKKNWELLIENRVRNVQITIDGPKAVHDEHRPIKNHNLPNYDAIMEGLVNMPDVEDLHITIRVNTDWKVAERFDEFLDDMERYGIWPQRYKSVNITNAYLRPYKEGNQENLIDTTCKLTHDEYDEVEKGIREMKLERFNRWAQSNNMRTGKIAMSVPKPIFEECWSIVSPYTLTIDAEGYTHKCWENIHDKTTRIQHVSEDFDIRKYSKWLDYSRFTLNSVCSNCKFLPVCGDNACAQAVWDGRNDCMRERGSLQKSLKDQYLLWVNNPDMYSFPRAEERVASEARG